MEWLVVVMICQGLECSYRYAEEHEFEQACVDGADEIHALLMEARQAGEGIATACLHRDTAVLFHQAIYDEMKGLILNDPR